MSELLKEQEAAKLIGLSVHWMRRKRWAGGGIPFIKIADGPGGAVRYRREEVEAFINSRTRKSTSDTGKAAA
jgi:predicted DNA-binding transcriptional regulator AlpA